MIHTSYIKNYNINHYFKVDYIYNYDDRRFGAVYLNDVRLIDNL